MKMLILEYVDITSILPKGQTEVKLTLLGISNLADTMDSFCEFVMIGAGDVALLHFFICFYATISSVSSLGQALNGWLSVPIDWRGYFWSEKGIFFLIYKHHIYGSHMSEKYQKLLKPREVRLVVGDVLKIDGSRKLYVKPVNEDFLLDESWPYSKYLISFIYHSLSVYNVQNASLSAVGDKEPEPHRWETYNWVREATHWNKVPSWQVTKLCSIIFFIKLTN